MGFCMGVKPYKIVAKIKNNRLWQAILVLYPEVKNQSHAATILKTTPSVFGYLLNMKWWPARLVHDEIRWAPIALKISRVLAYEPEYLFDPIYYGVKAVEAPKLVELEVGMAEIDKLTYLGLPPPVEDLIDEMDLHTQIEKVLATLTPREEQVIRARNKGETYGEIGENIAVSKERVRQIEAKANRKMRSPAIRKYLQTFAGE